MTKLVDLLESLTTVLVRYHDSQSNVTKLISGEHSTLAAKSRIKAKAILQDTENPYNVELTRIIDGCTNGYNNRKPLLLYIYQAIQFLKEIQDRKHALDPISLKELEGQIILLMTDLNKLISTIKDTTYAVQYINLTKENGSRPEIKIALAGLTNNGYLGNNFCNSGLLIKEEILDRFNIFAPHTNLTYEIKELAESLCLEHQNTLLVADLVRQCESLTKLTQSQKELINSLQVNNSSLQSELVAIKTEASSLQTKITNLNQRVTDLSHNGRQLNQGFFGVLSPRTTGLFQPNATIAFAPPPPTPGLDGK